MEYRYHRLADNSENWRQPTGGRLGNSDDFVGQNGFGHEDWNFSGAVWNDGRCHLYVRSEPAEKDRNKTFSIALGARTKYCHYVVGFCENATYAISDLSEDLKRVRAEQLHSLDKEWSLGGFLSGLSVKEKARRLHSSGEAYWIAVNQSDLILLDEAVPIPDSIVKRTYNRYGLIRLDQTQYESVRNDVADSPLLFDHEDIDFPEGQLVKRTHLRRERNPQIAREAKEHFVKKHGALRCEACDWPTDQSYPSSFPAQNVIEAHHDVWLSSSAHGGRTKVSDLRMLCPNCHRAIHRIRPWLLVDELRKKFFAVD